MEKLNLNTQEYTQLYKRAYYDAKKILQREELAEEIAQEVICQFIAGRNKHSTIHQTVIDCIRRYTGRKGTFQYDNKRIELHPNSPEWEVECAGNNESPTTLLKDDTIDIAKYSKLFRGRKKTIIDMHLEGYNNKEIGKTLKVSEFRISQILSSIKIDIIEFINKSMLASVLQNKDLRKWIMD